MKLKNNLTRKPQTMFHRIFIPIFCLMIMQSAIYFFATMYGGVIDSLNKNGDDILTERVINRKNELETTFNVKWANLSSYASIINTKYNEYKKKNGPLYDDKNGQKEFLNDISATMFKMLRDNEVNGVFIILNDSKTYVPLEDEKQNKYGLCIRDYDVNSSYTNKEDLLVVKCPSAMIRTIGCSLETWWDPIYSFTKDYNSDYYYEPLRAAYENPGVSSDNLAYFCEPHNYTANDKTVISYSMPLVDDTGYPYAVIGIEITVAYLESLFPSEELYGNNVGSYAMVLHNPEVDDGKLDVIAKDGIYYQKAFEYNTTLNVQKKNNNIFTTTDNYEDEVVIAMSDLKIYNDNTPFDGSRLAICGIIEKSRLYEFSNNIRNKLFLVTIFVLFIGMIGIFVVSKHLTAPITALSKKVRAMEPDMEPNLEHINISEIDLLISSIENLNRNISESRARTDFFSRMSHDMRTPMNAIIGFSSPEMLESANENQKEDYFNKIHTSGEYLLGLINEVLDMTKIDQGKMELRKTPVPAKDIVSSTLTIINEVASQKNIDFNVNIIDEDYYISVDVQRVSQVFMNLLSNAVKFTSPGGRVEYKQELIKRDDKMAVHKITISDNGRGMSEEFMERLYTPFSQENPGNEGTGLGLTISKRIVELMGGTLHCESKLGKGTIFEIMFKSQIVDAPVEASSSVLKKDFSKLAKKRILLCEDNNINTQIAKRLLELKGMEVECAVNGKEGCDKFAMSDEGHYDGILMDIRMPVMDGLKASKRIREMDRKDARTIPIIAMTANAFAEDVAESKRAGMNAHLSKPVDPQKIYETLAELIK